MSDELMKEALARYTAATINLLKIVDSIPPDNGDESDRVFAVYEFEELRQALFFASGGIHKPWCKAQYGEKCICGIAALAAHPEPVEAGLNDNEAFKTALGDFAKNHPNMDSYAMQAFSAGWLAKRAALSARGGWVSVRLEDLHRVYRLATGEDQVDDGEDAEDALRYIREILKAYIPAPPASSAPEPKKETRYVCEGCRKKLEKWEVTTRWDGTMFHRLKSGIECGPVEPEDRVQRGGEK